MKSLTATAARRRWFRLLDEVVAGEVVVIDRGGTLVELRRRGPRTRKHPVPDYSDVLRVPDLDQADRWYWEWQGPGEPLAPHEDGD